MTVAVIFTLFIALLLSVSFICLYRNVYFFIHIIK
jgi:hypothetical protein